MKLKQYINRSGSNIGGVASFLQTGVELTSRQAYSAGVANLSAVVHRLRVEGSQIYTNVRVSKNGTRKFSYGTVAAGN